VTAIQLSDYEVSGTITTGVMVWCPECETWFAEWTSRAKYPNVQQIIDACQGHDGECSARPTETTG
jgi:hypothetical protein